jgi:hypothetical protein
MDRWKDKVKVDVCGIGYEDANTIQVAQNRIQ